MRIGSLFSGYGGLEQGVQAVLGGSTAWVSDIDKGACKILAHRYPDAPNLGDISKVDWSQVEPIDVLTGGSPCQDLSHAGRRSGMTEGTRSNLWVAMREAIAQLRPGLVVWENVKGAYSAAADSAVEPCAGCVGDGSGVNLRALHRVLGDLATLGYDAVWRGLRASDVGAPHGRFRVFVAAYPSSSGPGASLSARRLQVEPRGSDRLAGRRLTAATEVWGPYAHAIARWGAVVGRPAPAANIADRLSPLFLEWLMGLPAGHVTDPVIWAGFSPAAAEECQLKALGNGVVPQQAAAALASMLTAASEVAA